MSSFESLRDEHKLLHRLFEEGLETFHLRKRNMSLPEMQRYIEKISPEYHNRIVLHNHFPLHQIFSLQGSHFTKNIGYEESMRDLNKSTQKRVDSLTKSYSIHTIQDLTSLPKCYDYVFLSPVFDSISNRGYNSKIKIKTLQRYFDSDSPVMPVVALGGIMPQNIALAARTGFAGTAILGYIWTDFMEHGNIKRSVERYRECRNMVVKEMALKEVTL